MTRQEEIAIVAAAISTPAGFSVEFNDLAVYRLEDGNFAVADEDDEKTFDTAEAAAAYFVERRHARQAGFDYETS